MKKTKISFYQIIAILSFSILLLPDYLKKINLLSNIYNYFNIIALLILFALYLLKKRKEKISLFELIILLYNAFFLAISITSRNSTYANYITIINQVNLCFLALASGRDRLKETLSSLTIVTTIYIIINLASLLLYPNGLNIYFSGYGNEITAWFLGTKNPSSRFIIISLCIRLCYKNTYAKTNLFDTIMIIIGVISILLLKSATGIVAIVGMILLVKFSKAKFAFKHINYSSIFAGGALLSFLMIKFNIQKFFESFLINVLNRDSSFTSRTTIWEKAVYYITQRPFVGYGYESDNIMFTKLLGNHPHNYYLFILYSTGIIGFMLLFLMFNEMSRKMNDSFSAKMGIVLFLSLIIMGLTESLTSTPLLYLSFVIIYFLSSNKEESLTNEYT